LAVFNIIFKYYEIKSIKRVIIVFKLNISIFTIYSIVIIYIFGFIESLIDRFCHLTEKITILRKKGWFYLVNVHFVE